MNAEDRRRQIKLVAGREFAQGGYQGTTTLTIARAAGLSEALVLKHFGSKSALFREAVIEPVLTMLDAIRDENLSRLANGARRSPVDDMTRLHEHLNELATFVRENHNLLLALLGEIGAFPAEGARLAAVVESHVADLSSSAALITATGEYRDFDPRLLTYVSLAAAAVAGWADDDTSRSTNEIVDVLFFGLLSARGRARVARAQPPGRPTKTTRSKP
jgi:AcrR family transcriptional regulator